MRPGVNVGTRDTAPPSSIPTDVGTCFMVGVTEAGPSTLTGDDYVQNLTEYEAKFAPTGRAYTAGIVTYDSADTFFAEGGNRLFVGRVTGPAATVASVDLMDGSAAVALHVEAKGKGEYGNNLQVVVRTTTQDPNITAGNFRIRVVRKSDNAVLDESYDLVDNTAALSWASTNKYIVLKAGVSALDPAAGSFDLASGASDVAGITNVSWQAAFDSLSIALGPGILIVPGQTTGSIYNMAADSALKGLRVAFLDGADTPTAQTLITAAKAIVDSTLKRARFAGLFAPWVYIPGVASSTVRKIPPSAAVAGVFARNMSAGLSANEPAAGDNGRFRTVIGHTQTYTDVDRQSLNNNGIDVCRDVYGIKKIYGWRTVADPVTDPRWINLGNSILHRQIVALANLVGESFIFKQIDGQGRLVGQFGAALVGHICMPLYADGSLYGLTSEEAYKVDIGPSVNTDATIANNELHAVMSVKMSPFGEEVDIDIVKYLITESIPA